MAEGFDGSLARAAIVQDLEEFTEKIVDKDLQVPGAEGFGGSLATATVMQSWAELTEKFVDKDLQVPWTVG